jgi:hypothetical protein
MVKIGAKLPQNGIGWGSEKPNVRIACIQKSRKYSIV